MLKRLHNSLNGNVRPLARQMNSSLRLMVSFTFQGMDGSGRSIARKCQPCPRTPVSYVSSLYTAAKKVTAAPHKAKLIDKNKASFMKAQAHQTVLQPPNPSGSDIPAARGRGKANRPTARQGPRQKG